MKSSKVTQNSSYVFIAILAFVTVFTRFYGLTFKPIHFDEAINAWFSSQVQQMGYYKYDPVNYHGPLYFYILRFFEIAFGKSLWTLRAVPTVFSIASILVFLIPITGTPNWRRWVAGLLLISPAMVFFGRSGIHEMPFVFFQILFALGLLRGLENKDDTSLSLLLVGLFGMVTLKETFAVSLASFAAGIVALGFSQARNFLNIREWKKSWNRSLTLLFVLLLCCFLVLFTGFFKNPAGFADFFRAFLPWMKTGVGGNGHDKYFGYWLETMAKVEVLALFGVLAAIRGLYSRKPALRMISAFSLAQLLVYSLIPYKTVWCILSLVWGFYFVLAYTAEDIEKKNWRYAFYGIVAVLGCFNLVSAYQSSWQYPVNMSHPYIYVNSTYSVPQVDDFLTKAATENSEKITMQIGMEEQWPWPWILRDYVIQSYDVCAKSIIPDLDVYFCDPKDAATLEAKLSVPYWKAMLEFRQDRGSASAVYFKKSRFPQVPFEGAIELGGEIK